MNASHAGNYVAFGSEATHLLGIDVMEQKLPPGSASSMIVARSRFGF
jgi:phosphopantetheinyl transferase